MMRRITAALLALIILISVMPARANADEIIYTKGQSVRKDKDLLPPYSTEGWYDPSSEYQTAYGYMWELDVDSNGAPDLKCILEKHEHLDILGCYDEDNNTICGKDEHICRVPYKECTVGYEWHVVRDPNYVLWYDDPDAPENYEFAVCCYDPEGIVPMAGVELKLFQKIQLNDKEVNDPVVSKDGSSMLTSKYGYYYFTGECREDLPEGDATWYLVQMADEFKSTEAHEGKYYNQYRSNGVKWAVDVHVNGDGTYTLLRDIYEYKEEAAVAAMAEEPEEDDIKPVQGYDSANRRLVIVNQPVDVKVHIDLVNAPFSMPDLNAVITHPNGYEETVAITDRHYSSGSEIILPPGDYSVQVDTGRYPVVYKVHRTGEEPAEVSEMTLSLDADHSNGYFKVYFASLSNTVKLYSTSADASGEEKPITNVEYGLYRENGDLITTLSSEDASVAVIDSNGWKELLKDDYETMSAGDSFDITVKQSRTPDNHEASADAYTLRVKKTEEGSADHFDVELLMAEGVSFGENNEQIATFKNQRQDLSHLIIPKAQEKDSDLEITVAAEYALTDAETEAVVAELKSGETLDMKSVMETYGDKAEFLLTQKTAPANYELSEDSYAVTAAKDAEGNVTVELKKQDVGLMKAILRVFGLERIDRGEFNEWIPVFTNGLKGATEPTEYVPEKHNNTVILRAEDRDGNPANGAAYELFKDGEALGVEFDSEGQSEIVITSDDWMDVAMAMYMGDLPEEDKDILISGGSVYVTLKQTVTPEDHEEAAEVYTLEVRRSKAEDGIEDQFFIKVMNAENGTKVQYRPADDAQIATFINRNPNAEASKETAELKLTLEDINIQWNGAEDSARYAAYENGEYEFVLSLKDQNGDWQPESQTITLKKGAANTFRTRIPLGTAYKVAPAGSGHEFNAVFTGAQESSNGEYVGEAQTAEVISLSAALNYEVKLGSQEPGLELVAVDSEDITKTLAGAAFVLKDAGGKELTTYTTTQDGKISITGLADQPADYTLQETAAPEGYIKLSAAIPVTVKYQYTAEENTDGSVSVVQDLVAAASHENLASGYYIKYSKQNTAEPNASAKINLSLNDIKIQWNDAVSDNTKREYYNNREYEFILYWKDTSGAWQKDPNSLKLMNDAKSNSGTFQKEIPVGVAYKINLAEPKADYNVEFTNAADGSQAKWEYEGTVASAADVNITAEVKYVLELGDSDPTMEMVKVYARDTSKTLAGAKFTLKGKNTNAQQNFTTEDDGLIEITFGQVKSYPATYTLKENTAPDNYVKLTSAINITVDYRYSTYNDGDDVIVVQDLVATAEHSNVTLGRDGRYYIKNVHEDDNPKTGDSFHTGLWISALVISAAGLAAVLAAEAKKRAVR